MSPPAKVDGRLSITSHVLSVEWPSMMMSWVFEPSLGTRSRSAGILPASLRAGTTTETIGASCRVAGSRLATRNVVRHAQPARGASQRLTSYATSGMGTGSKIWPKDLKTSQTASNDPPGRTSEPPKVVDLQDCGLGVLCIGRQRKDQCITPMAIPTLTLAYEFGVQGVRRPKRSFIDRGF